MYIRKGGSVSKHRSPESNRLSRRSLLGVLGTGSLALGLAAAGGTGLEPGQALADGLPFTEPVPPGLRPYDEFVAQQAAHDQFSGTVLLAHRGRPVLARSYGMANKALSIPNKQNTIFGLASLSKIFAGIAISQLAAQGKIDFSATLGTYLDGFSPEIANYVTVHQMLCHISGMGNYQASPIWQEQSRTWSTPAQEFADTMAVIRQSPLLFTPGLEYGYSNSGYYTLGAIAAQVSGQPYGDYLRGNVFRPAHMLDTNYYTTAQILANPNIAHAYGALQPDGTRVDLTAANRFVQTGGGAGSGGGMSSAPDLLNLVLTLQTNGLIDDAYTRVVISGKYPLTSSDVSDQPPGPCVMSGYGFEQRIVNGHRIFGHGGSSPLPGGIAVDLSIYADLEWVSVLLSNYYVNTLPYLELVDGLLTQEGTMS
jgi:CubicO group peptidase (beta-lactamase class C family)